MFHYTEIIDRSSGPKGKQTAKEEVEVGAFEPTETGMTFQPITAADGLVLINPLCTM